MVTVTITRVPVAIHNQKRKTHYEMEFRALEKVNGATARQPTNQQTNKQTQSTITKSTTMWYIYMVNIWLKAMAMFEMS